MFYLRIPPNCHSFSQLTRSKNLFSRALRAVTVQLAPALVSMPCFMDLTRLLEALRMCSIPSIPFCASLHLLLSRCSLFLPILATWSCPGAVHLQRSARVQHACGASIPSIFIIFRLFVLLFRFRLYLADCACNLLSVHVFCPRNPASCHC